MSSQEKLYKWMYKHRSVSYTTAEIAKAVKIDVRYCAKLLKTLQSQGKIGKSFNLWWCAYAPVKLPPKMLNIAQKRARKMLKEDEESARLDVVQELNDIRANRAEWNNASWYEPNIVSMFKHLEKISKRIDTASKIW